MRSRFWILMVRFSRVGLLIFSFILLFCADGPVGGISSKIEAFIRPYADTGNFSGAVLVARDGEVMFHRGFGMASVEHSVPVSEETRFFIASVTKSFTATAILLLEEEGRLSLEDPVARFLPDFPNGRRITIRHLLTHTSGLPRIIFFPDYWECSLQHATAEEVVAYFRDAPLVAEPGGRSSYSNANYALLAHLIERISGMAYADFLRTRLWEPLGMADTGFLASMIELIPNLASGYEVVGETDFKHAAYHDRSWGIGSGSIYSTPLDLFRWIQGVRGNRVLTPETTRRMFDTEYGCGWIMTERHGRQAIQLTGWDNLGFSADMLHFPEDSLTVVVLGNLDIISVTNEISDGVSAMALGEEHTPLALSDDPVDAALASKIVGTYRWGDDFYVPGATIQIVEEDGRLFAKQENGLVGILRVSELEFIHRMSWARMAFSIDDDGEIREMLYYGRFKTVKQAAE